MLIVRAVFDLIGAASFIAFCIVFAFAIGA